MSGNTSDSSSYFGGREPDAVIKALVCKRRDTDGEITLGLQFWDLESDEVFISTMPPCAPLSSTPVACGNHVYVLGGIRKDDATFDGYDDVKDVFQLDLKDLERGWRKTTSMLFPRALPLALAAEGKIYVFDQFGSDSFGEVYDISKDIWEPLLPPPEHIALPGPVLLDSPRSRILVHCDITKSLYGYYYDSKSWDCLDPKFFDWSNSTAIVDDLLYTFLYSYSGDFLSVRAYDVLDMKHLPVKWSSEFSVEAPRGGTLFRLGNGKCILGWVEYRDKIFEYIIFNMWRNEQGVIRAGAEQQSAIIVPFRSKEDIWDIILF